MTNDDIIILESHTLFDKLPKEIIFNIFNYLSCNDIIYTFFLFNSRLNHLLLEHEHYLNNLELPITNLNYWQNILSIIGSKIKTLKISTIDLSLSLDLFPNIKSIIITSLYGLSNRSLQTLLANKQFQILHTFKIKSKNYLKPRSSLFCDNFEHYLFTKIFNEENLLEIFEYLTLTTLFSRKILNNLQINSSLLSLTLCLHEFIDIFSVLQYTPNLIYLNVKTTLSDTHKKQNECININNIKLKQLYLTFVMKHSTRLQNVDQQLDFLHLISDIKLFSSTLICLSMNFVDLNINDIDEFPLNGFKLQHQLLESMIELKQFYLYSKVKQDQFNIDNVISTFKDQFWFDHKWFVGMHGNYLYTLPFSFNELYGFSNFDEIQSNHDDILNSSRIWYNVKLIELARSNKFDLNLIKQIKIRMPKLISIKFISSGLFSYSETIEKPSVTEQETLTNIETVDLIGGSIENIKQWLIYILPNVKHLILSYTGLPLLNSHLSLNLDKKIQRLDIYEYSIIEQMNITDYFYFSNVEHIQLILYNIEGKFEWYVKTLMKIFQNYNQLKILSVCIIDKNHVQTYGSSEVELSKIIEYLKINHIIKNYDVQRHRECALFLKI
ncbi:unnamed protein product [Adineta steineri]|uniref:F-box domain-containing protein n=1 Tax=Adineta steineri TaxID=433720 RepID=A0A814XUS4_9BILA|nr:unnamed protein product [Adineta steineri]CAF4133046.1 unnamed protein product [Adineta steineri]